MACACVWFNCPNLEKCVPPCESHFVQLGSEPAAFHTLCCLFSDLVWVIFVSHFPAEDHVWTQKHRWENQTAECRGLAMSNRWLICPLLSYKTRMKYPNNSSTFCMDTLHDALLANCQPSLTSESLWTNLAVLTVQHTGKCSSCLFIQWGYQGSGSGNIFNSHELNGQWQAMEKNTPGSFACCLKLSRDSMTLKKE